MGETWLLIGAPAVGKSTFSYNLKKACSSFKQFSVRVHVQKLIEEQTQLGKEIEEGGYLTQNALIPDDIVESVFRDFVNYVGENEFLLIEGFPINDAQFKYMLENLKEKKRNIDGMIILEEDYEVLIERVQKRMVCRRCELNNTAGVPIPFSAKSCPYCGDMLVKRLDDNLITFQRRYLMYLEEKERLLQWIPKEQVILVKSTESNQLINSMTKRINREVNICEKSTAN